MITNGNVKTGKTRKGRAISDPAFKRINIMHRKHDVTCIYFRIFHLTPAKPIRPSPRSSIAVG